MANTATRSSMTIYQLRGAFALLLPILTTISGPVFEKMEYDGSSWKARAGSRCEAALEQNRKHFFSYRVTFWLPKIRPQFTRLSLKGILGDMAVRLRNGIDFCASFSNW